MSQRSLRFIRHHSKESVRGPLVLEDHRRLVMRDSLLYSHHQVGMKLLKHHLEEERKGRVSDVLDLQGPLQVVELVEEGDCGCL
jgi:hypothetical protein